MGDSTGPEIPLEPDPAPTPEAAEVSESVESTSEVAEAWESGSDPASIEPLIETEEDIEWDEGFESAYQDAAADELSDEFNDAASPEVAPDSGGEAAAGITEPFNEAAASNETPAEPNLSEEFNAVASAPEIPSDGGDSLPPVDDGVEAAEESLEPDLPEAAEDALETLPPVGEMEGLSREFNDAADPDAPSEEAVETEEEEGGEEAEDPTSLDLNPPWRGPRGPTP